MPGIGDYVHYKYANFKKYGINKNGTTEDGPAMALAIFKSQKRDILNDIKRRQRESAINIPKLEEELNFYYGPNKEGLRGDITDEDLKKMHDAIQQFLGDKLNGIDIDIATLSSAVGEGNMSKIIDIFKNNTHQELNEKIKTIVNAPALGNNPSRSTKKSAVQRRIDMLLEIRDAAAKENVNLGHLSRQIGYLNDAWQKLQADLGDSDKIYLGYGYQKNRSFVNRLNEMISSFVMGSSTMHGEYAEAVLVLVNYMVNSCAAVETSDLLRVLKEGSSKQRVAGQDRSANALISTHFSSDFADLNLITKGSAYTINQKDGAGNIFSGRATQDKVDVWLEVEGLSVPASVKNYNMANTSNGVHVLSGRSVLQLIQEYENFTNYYMNVMVNHPDGSAPGALQQSAKEALKLTILLKAIAGGTITANGRKNSEADIFIINDNSKGGFKIYTISDILERVNQNLDLLQVGDIDTLSELDNNYIGTENNSNDALVRISGILAQLHQMQLNVSISKAVF